jgi:soluble lytic murein transglycosylase-like protein
MNRKSKRKYREINAGLFSNHRRSPRFQVRQLKYRLDFVFLCLHPAGKIKSLRDRSWVAVQSVMKANKQRPLFRLVGLILWIFAATMNMMVLANTADINDRPLVPIPSGSGNVDEKRAAALIFSLKRLNDRYLKIPSVPEQPPSQKKPEIQFYNQIIDRAATLYRVDPDLILAMVMVESSFRPLAGSRKNASGLMQLMPGTAKELGVLDIFNPEENILAGVKYFRKLLNKFEGDVELALAAYNAGFRKVRIYKGVPPFKETREYIDKVFQYYAYYKIKNFLEEGINTQ